MSSSLQSSVQKAAALIKSQSLSTRFRVVSHYDADGITAAAIICYMLRREGYDFHSTLMRNPFTKGLERLHNEQNDIIIFTDMGSGQLPILETFTTPIIIIDHHQVIKENTPDRILQINANLYGINGNYEASGASMAYAVAIEVNQNNRDLASLALAGVTGDKQYIGGFKGYNLSMIQQALEHKIVQSEIGIKLSGNTLLESIYYSIDPFYPGLSGNKKNIESLLKKLDVAPELSYHDLTNDQRQTLHSLLLITLIEKGCTSTILDTIIRLRYTSSQTHGEMEQFADLLDSCGKGGNRDIGLAVCLGDTNAYDQAVNQEKTYKERILEELLILEKDGVKEQPSFRYFYSVHSSLGGVVGGIATNFLLDDKKPLISIVKKPDELHVSCRGNQNLVSQGLDLGAAMEQIGKKFNGHGGGHKIAAGATIPAKAEKDFITELNVILTKQMNKQSELP